MDDLLLDSQIRDWVLLPIFFVMIILSILRHNISKWISTSPKKVDIKTQKQNQILLRVRRLRANANVIPPEGFLSRKQYFNHKKVRNQIVQKDRQDAETLGGRRISRHRALDEIMRESLQFVHEMTAAQDGILQVQKDPNPMANPMMSNPSLIFEGMRKNLPHMILQPMVMAWVSYFFAGFVLVKIPFGLTPRFKSMLQRGVELDSLDVSYVSSLSWYLLTLFGLMGVNSLILGSDGTGDEMMMADPIMAQTQQMATAQVIDPTSAMISERENLELTVHEWIGTRDIEGDLMKKSDLSL